MKGLIWYDPKVYKGGVPTSFDDMNAKAKTALASLSGTKEWCVALESGAASGWPGSDWLEDIVLRQDGADFYNNWAAGKAKWNGTGAPERLQDLRHRRGRGQRLRRPADRQRDQLR